MLGADRVRPLACREAHQGARDRVAVQTPNPLAINLALERGRRSSGTGHTAHATVEDRKETWTFSTDDRTAKVGDKATVYHKMMATEIEAKTAAPAAKPAK